MGTTPLPRDRLCAAEAEVARTKAELEAACEQARRDKPRTDWLADHPELARLDRLIGDIPFRKEKLARAVNDYNSAYNQRLNATLFTAPPDLERDIRLFRE